MRKAMLSAVVIILGLCLCLWLVLPTLVRSQIHKRYPEITFESLEMSWTTAKLHNVRVDRGWIVAEAKLVTMTAKSNDVHLESGSLQVDLDKKPPSASTGEKVQWNFIVDNFGAIVESKARGLKAVAAVVHIDGIAITADGVQVEYQDRVANLTKAVISRDLKRGVIEEVTFPEGLSTGDGRHTISPVLQHVEFDRESETVTVGRASCGLDLGKDHVAVALEGLKMQRDVYDVAIQADQVEVSHPWLSAPDRSVHFQHVAVNLTLHETLFQDPFDVKIAGATLHFNPKTLGLTGDETCQTWQDALPPEFHVGPLSTVKFPVGSLSFAFALKPKPTFSLKGSCTSTCDTVTEPHHKFSYITYNKDGEQNANPRTTGPDLKDQWVVISQINETMPIAVRNMEDFGFYGHHGFLPEALEQSFVADVTSGKFQRGGSTITMQTAKNLWLSREKTLSRKIEELFLSQVLESCLTKDEILELYLNIVEFGPDVYGVKQAAAHYFKSEPMKLSPREAFYLAWILPHPRKAPAPTAVVMSRMSTLMQMLATHDGRIPESMMLSIEPADTTGWEQPP